MNLQGAIISWDNAWKFDYLFRRKYKVPFNSSEHRKMNQIDQRLDLLESEIYDDQLENYRKEDKELEELKKGVWFKPHTEEDFEKERSFVFSGCEHTPMDSH